MNEHMIEGNMYEKDKQVVLEYLPELLKDITEEAYCHHTLYKVLEIAEFLRRVLQCEEIAEEEAQTETIN
jgi:hypothetical protein